MKFGELKAGQQFIPENGSEHGEGVMICVKLEVSPEGVELPGWMIEEGQLHFTAVAIQSGALLRIPPDAEVLRVM